MQQAKFNASAFKLSLIASAIAGMAFSSSSVLAQEQASVDEQDVEQIQIVGSRRVGRTINDSPVPIDIIDASSIEATGLTETNMILNQLLPSFNFPQPSITDGTDHVQPAQLRGLAPDHTLVLVNGKRRHTSALLNLNGSVGRGSSAVDLNAIPANAIKRIEELGDGAAAQYGSDPKKKVINIVLKDAAEKREVSATYGANVTTMEGVPNLEGVSVGADGNLAFAEGSDRDVTDGQTFTLRGNVGFEWGDDGFVNVSGEYRDRGQANRSDYDQRENYARDADGNLDPRELTVNRYNHVYGNGEVEDYAITLSSLFCDLPVSTSMQLSGSATRDNGTGEITLTQDLGNQAGSAWSNERISLLSAFTVEFSVYLGTKNAGGADGIAFAFQNDPAGNSATGVFGGALGVGGKISIVTSLT